MGCLACTDAISVVWSAATGEWIKLSKPVMIEKKRCQNMSKKPRQKLRPTMTDVAREAGVSLSTVDRVLNLRADVRTDTAQRIAAAAA
ncbi:hypothetical protein ALQ59_04718, partial [Pseudomonas syringae pv. apii]